MSNGGADRPAGISGTIPKVQINDLLLLTIVAKSTGSIIVLILELKSIANARIGKLGTNGTKRYNFIYYLRIIILLCEKMEEIQINLDPNGRTDTIYVSELITENPVAELYPTSVTATARINSPRVAKIYSKGEKFSYLTILAPDKDLNIYIKPDSSLTTDSRSDSLVNYL